MANATLQKLIDVNFNFVSNEVLPLIEKEYLRVSATEIADRVKLTILAATEGGISKEKLVEIWSNLPSDPQIVNAIKLALQDAIGKLNEPEIQEGLNLLLNPVVESLVVLVDQKDGNKEQLGVIWKNFLNDPALLAYGIQHLEWLIKKIIKDDNAVKWIMKLINAFTSK